MQEHAVMISFNYGIQEMDPLYELADNLEKEIKNKQVGEYDGHEIAIDNCKFKIWLNEVLEIEIEI